MELLWIVATGLKNRKGARAPNDDRVGSPDRTGLRFLRLAGQIGSPIVHQDTPALEQVRAPIGRLGRIQMV